MLPLIVDNLKRMILAVWMLDKVHLRAVCELHLCSMNVVT